jgi:hypothetical protein
MQQSICKLYLGINASVDEELQGLQMLREGA